VEKFRGKYRIQSNRCKYWDYSNAGFYFITICTIDRECFLGEINNGIMILSLQGEIVRNEILKMPDYNARVVIDECVIMPNHIHLLIELTNGDNGGDGGDGGNGGDGDGCGDVEKIHEFSLQRTTQRTTQPWWHNPNYKPTTDEIKQYRKQRRQMIIPKILGKLQMQTSKQINILNETPGHKNWQPNYHDHIIRDDQSYQRIKQYIINNPKKWDDDKFHN